MQTEATEIAGVIVISPTVHGDRRGLFVEPWQRDRYAGLGIGPDFTQDGLSVSQNGVLRGLHYQIIRPQGHLITVLRGRIFDVALDLRTTSPTFRRWTGRTLDGERLDQIWLPPGIAHGFCVVGDEAMVHYKMTSPYLPGDEGGVHWADPDLAIAWPVKEPILSDKDRRLPRIQDIPVDRLPQV